MNVVVGRRLGDSATEAHPPMEVLRAHHFSKELGQGSTLLKVNIQLNSLFLSGEGPMLETLDYTIRIASTSTFLYFDLYLYSAYAALDCVPVHYARVMDWNTG